MKKIFGSSNEEAIFSSGDSGQGLRTLDFEVMRPGVATEVASGTAERPMAERPPEAREAPDAQAAKLLELMGGQRFRTVMRQLRNDRSRRAA